MDKDKYAKQFEFIANIYNMIREKPDDQLYDIYSPVIPDLFVNSITNEIKAEVDLKRKLEKTKDKEEKESPNREKIISMLAPINPTWKGIDMVRRCVDKFMETCSNAQVGEEFIYGTQKLILGVLKEGTQYPTYTTSKLISLGMYTAYNYLPNEGPNPFMKIIVTDFFPSRELLLPFFAAWKEFINEYK